MKSFYTVLLTVLLTFNCASAQVTEKEAKREVEKLLKLKKEIELLIKEKEELLKKIEAEREKLRKEREEFEKRVKEVEEERFKKLARVFEKMDPELAGDKISNMKNPREAAYIIYNMKERKAGEVLNYVKPEMVNRIVEILTELKENQ